MARGSLVWFNGKILSTEDAKISLFTHALHYGMGAFEGIRAYKQKKEGGAVFRLREHLERLLASCKILDLKIPYSLSALTQATLETVRANQFEECYIRPIVYIADGPLGLYPGPNPPVEVAILTWEWGNYLGDKGVTEGARLKTSSFIRPHVNSALTKGKITGQYVNNVMAKREAVGLGFDEALLLDTEGFLTEGSGENLFMIKNGLIKTTSLTSILNGITRQTVCEYFHQTGRQIQEARFSRDELWCADEVFLTGTAAEITPVREIDGRLIGPNERSGKPGPTTVQLQKDFQAMVRGEYQEEFCKTWLTPLLS